MKKLPILIFLSLFLINFVEAITFISPVQSLYRLVLIVLNYLFTVSFWIVIIVLVWAGILMITASGNEEQFQQGKRLIIYAVIGFAVVIMGKGIVDLIRNYLVR
jgi:hypothetical protein